MFVGVRFQEFPTFAVMVLDTPHGRCGHNYVAFRDDNIIVCAAFQAYYAVIIYLSTLHRTLLPKGFRSNRQAVFVASHKPVFNKTVFCICFDYFNYLSKSLFFLLSQSFFRYLYTSLPTARFYQ